MSIVLGLTGSEINFLVVSNRAIRKINRRYLRHDYVTDVIAFPLTPTPSRGGRGGKNVGDIVISSDTAKRQAREEGHSLLTEMKILAIHGVLHLLGYRDKKPQDRRKMWKKTDEILARIEEGG